MPSEEVRRWNLGDFLSAVVIAWASCSVCCQGECVVSSVLSLQQKFEMVEQCYSLVAAQFCLADKENTSTRA